MNDRDWKQLYDDLLRQRETEQEANQELEELLGRTVSRLTLAVAGLDPHLDPYLRGVREAVKSGVRPRLRDKLSDLADALVRYGSDAAPGEAVAPAADYRRLLGGFLLSKRAFAEAEKLMSQLVEDPLGMSEERFKQLIALLGGGADSSAARHGGFFDRLLGGGRAKQGADVGPNEILLNLLEQASWPGYWSGRIGAFKGRLGSEAGEDAWISVLQELLELSAKSFGEVQKEVREAEDFLEELTKRLQDLGSHLEAAHVGRDKILQHGRDLGAKVTDHMGELGTSVAQATDLQQLKLTVSERLNLIKQNIDTYIKEEAVWHRQAEASEKELHGRLVSLEKESYELRSRMLEAHHLALLDTVTGLPNRLAYEERVEQEYARWKRFGDPLTLLVWDVDDFKSINDRFGHQAGDKALRVIARSLQARLRTTDFIARFGGEEFVCLLCGAKGREALKVAEEMRRSVEENGFHSHGKPVPVTISCGIATFSGEDSRDGVFARADKALYEAKRAGKNRCALEPS